MKQQSSYARSLVNKTQFVCVLLLCTVCTITYGNPYRTIGTGATEQEAVYSGLRKAVEQSKIILVTESRTKHRVLTQDDIIQYSSAYIDDYIVISKRNDGAKYIVELEVLVRDNRFAERLKFNSDEPSVIDGEKLSTIGDSYIQSVQKSRVSGSKILGNVLRDYPNNALNAKIINLELVRGGDNLYLSINLSLTWNDAYLSSLGDALDLVQVKNKWPNCGHCYVRISNKYINSLSKKYEFLDEKVISNVYLNFARDVTVRFNFISKSGNTIHSACYSTNLKVAPVNNLQIELASPYNIQVTSQILYNSSLSYILRDTTKIGVEITKHCN